MDGRKHEILRKAKMQFGVQNFDADKYCENYFEENPIDNSAMQIQDLKNQKNATAEALKESVYRDYKEFIHSTMEIQHLESEILEVKHHLADAEGLLRNMQTIQFGIQLVSKTVEDEEKRESKDDSIPDSLLWLAEVPDDIDTQIYKRRYEPAVNLVEKAREAIRDTQMTVGIQKIAEKISSSANELANVLMKDLSTQTDPAVIRRCVRQLIALHKGKVAQSLFLKNASNTIEKSIKSLPLSKDFITYMEEYTRVTFETIKTTADSFNSLFANENPRSLSAFIVWVTQEIDSFCKALIMKTCGSNSALLPRDDFVRFTTCVKNSYKIISELEKSGLTFTFHFTNTLQKEIKTIVANYFSSFKVTISEAIENENWSIKRFKIEEEQGGVLVKRNIFLTNCGQIIYEIVNNLAIDLQRLAIGNLSRSLHQCILPGLMSILKSFFNYITKHIDENNKNNKKKGNSSGENDDDENIALITNLYYLSHDLIKRVTSCLTCFGLNTDSDFRHYCDDVVGYYNEFSKKFCNTKSSELMKDWTPKDYVYKNTMPEGKGWTSRALAIQKMIIQIRETLCKYIGDEEGYRLTTIMCDNILHIFDQHKDWKEKPVKTRESLHTYLLDVYLIYNITRDFTKDKTDDLLNAEQRAIDAVKEEDEDVEIEKDSWFSKRLPYQQ